MRTPQRATRSAGRRGRGRLARLAAAAALVAAAACNGEQARPAADGGADTTTAIRCGEGTSGTLTPGGRLEVSGPKALDLAGAAVSAPAGHLTASPSLTSHTWGTTPVLQNRVPAQRSWFA